MMSNNITNAIQIVVSGKNVYGVIDKDMKLVRIVRSVEEAEEFIHEQSLETVSVAVIVWLIDPSVEIRIEDIPRFSTIQCVVFANMDGNKNEIYIKVSELNPVPSQLLKTGVKELPYEVPVAIPVFDIENQYDFRCNLEEKMYFYYKDHGNDPNFIQHFFPTKIANYIQKDDYLKNIRETQFMLLSPISLNETMRAERDLRIKDGKDEWVDIYSIVNIRLESCHIYSTTREHMVSENIYKYLEYFNPIIVGVDEYKISFVCGDIKFYLYRDYYENETEDEQICVVDTDCSDGDCFTDFTDFGGFQA